MSNAPVKKVSLKGINVTVWENEFESQGKKFTKRSVSITKNYKQGEEWKSTTNLNPDDIPYAIEALAEVFRWNYIKDEPNDVDF